MDNKILLKDNWHVFLEKERDIPQGFMLPENGVVARVPGTIHSDLLRAGLIPDPFFGTNEKDLQWIARNDWRYETHFDLPEHYDPTATCLLVFEGLDTVAEIWLNGHLLAKTKNMFRTYRFEVGELLARTDNQLKIVFRSPLQWVKEQKSPIRQMPSVRHPDRVFLRKSQYSFGWDWGPQFPTSGLWRPVYLLQKSAGLEHFYFETKALRDDQAVVRLGCTLWGNVPQGAEVAFVLKHDGKRIEGTLARKGPVAQAEICIANPLLWWPNGEGQPILHELDFLLKEASGNILDKQTRQVGIRTVELVTEEKAKPVFYFKINGRKIFAKGADWIPAHAFLPEVTDDTYTHLLDKARQANMNMIRVWGGGIYEDEMFYALCDQLGLMVWQDFMFACAAYPEDDDFVAEVEAEIRENVARLQTHPSIVIWCGNNENEWIWHRDMATPVDQMPGFNLFHHIFPEWLKVLDPSRPYWPSTPWGQDADPNSPNSGNRHVWEIWSWWQDYTTVEHDQSLFVTEFGFQAPAHVQTLKENLPTQEFAVQSFAFEWHNKQEEGPERLFRFLSAHLPVRTDPSDFIYLTQLNQAFALQTCLEHWRTNGVTSGAIIWQLNDCWPVSSWSLIDSRLRPKLSYYQVRRSLATLLLTFGSTTDHEREVLVLNSSSELFKGYFELLKMETPKADVKTIINKRFQIGPGETVALAKLTGLLDNEIYLATIYDEKQIIVMRRVFASQPWKYLRLPDVRGKIDVRLAENNVVELYSSVAAFFIELRHPVWNFSDQGFVMLPGEKRRLKIENMTDVSALQALEIVTLNQYLD